MEGFTLANGGNKTKRRKLDFYPTPPEVTHSLMQFFNLNPCTILEPACGNGEMSNVLKQYGHTVKSSDIRHTGYGEGGINFLTKKYTKYDAIITNPPFKESEAFIQHAVPQAPFVAMVLKSQYWHAKKRIKLFKDFPPAYILAMTWRPDFGGGGCPTMDTLWTVWIEWDKNTKYRLLNKKTFNNLEQFLTLKAREIEKKKGIEYLT